MRALFRKTALSRFEDVSRRRPRVTQQKRLNSGFRQSVFLVVPDSMSLPRV
jgi:hypothetical protein